MHGFAFVPRPFPPPSLADVPLEYVIDQLRRFAPHYWSKPETSDCTIVVPLGTGSSVGASPNVESTTMSPPSDGAFLSFGQQAEESPLRPAPCMVMQLHMDYLCAHSTLLRGLLSGASPFDLLASSSHSFASAQVPMSGNALPCPSILPSPPTRPSIYLPIPDPASFRMLVHYIYFGSTEFIEDALDEGKLSWEGLARNAEYLGMGSEIKVFLGHWYTRWMRGRAPGGYDSDSENEHEAEDGSGDELEMPMQDISAATSPTVFDPDEMYYRADDEDEDFKKVHEAPRGRQRTTRRLGHATSDPGLSSSCQQVLKRAPRGRSK
ncbi:uncharacterized protein LAESUDRAFT_646490 [Laetiporus sulphureus 93-53]|uniref:BTB domain-containing protein n=1 Tax=Laetiporus sulphureus 93-53 TaxID=1314785 RepID=A0A165G303_9APHY|nr:uncharacterized protein LAESUDRAFT_646490 [Laetiporus sulphureus 93-53]KZT09759.1 hypothetical protein LAESUDRAFT_646490 [Laetiporus sulphureus 93-53]